MEGLFFTIAIVIGLIAGFANFKIEQLGKTPKLLSLKNKAVINLIVQIAPLTAGSVLLSGDMITNIGTVLGSWYLFWSSEWITNFWINSRHPKNTLHTSSCKNCLNHLEQRGIQINPLQLNS